jgi:hypothetical protein
MKALQVNLLRPQREAKQSADSGKSALAHPHTGRYLGINRFCKQCSLYLPDLGSQALRCSQLEGNLTGINPNDELSQMLQKVKRKKVLSELGRADRQERQRAVESISSLASRLNLSSLIIGSAITHFDLFMDSRGHLSFQKLEIATVCLLLATKFYEPRASPEPKSLQLAALARKQIGERALKLMELEVSHELDWAFNSQTCVHFLRFFFSKGKRVSCRRGLHLGQAGRGAGRERARRQAEAGLLGCSQRCHDDAFGSLLLQSPADICGRGLHRFR